jgi:zinc transporter 1/2/3
MDILLIKAIFLVTIFFSGVAGGWLPFRLSGSARGERALNLGHAFAGGVFLGAGLIHLLTDGQEHFENWLGGFDYPFTFLIAGVGFLLVLCIERVIIHGENLHETHTMKTHPYLLTLVLSIHSVIAGVALGLEGASLTAIALFVAIIAHKSFAAFALSVSFHDAKFDPAKTKRTLLIFSAMTPLGVLLGGVAASLFQGTGAHAVEGIFDALAAGTFIYVATLDIVREAFSDGHDRWQKFAWLSLGFGLMALLAVWT